MKIWCLRISVERFHIDLAKLGYYYRDDVNGYIVIAENETEARVMCRNNGVSSPDEWWMRPDLTSCEEVAADTARIVLADTPTG